jgi:hypothetical protein
VIFIKIIIKYQKNLLSIYEYDTWLGDPHGNGSKIGELKGKIIILTCEINIILLKFR